MEKKEIGLTEKEIVDLLDEGLIFEFKPQRYKLFDNENIIFIENEN